MEWLLLFISNLIAILTFQPQNPTVFNLQFLLRFYFFFTFLFRNN